MFKKRFLKSWVFVVFIVFVVSILLTGCSSPAGDEPAVTEPDLIDEAKQEATEEPIAEGTDTPKPEEPTAPEIATVEDVADGSLIPEKFSHVLLSSCCSIYQNEH